MLHDAIDLAQRLGVNPDYRHGEEYPFQHSMLSSDDLWFAQHGAIKALQTQPLNVVLQQGPSLSSLAIANYGFDEALEYLSELEPPTETIDYLDNRVSALTNLGQQLIAAAMHSLPDDIVELVPQWQHADLIERAELMEKLSAVFEAWFARFVTHPYDKWTLWDERLKRVWPEEDIFSEQQYGVHHVLPRMYGKADTSLLRPNCLGVSIMLAAWCEMAGAKYWYCNTLRDRGTGLREIRRELYHAVSDSFTMRNIEVPQQRQFEIFKDSVALSGLSTSAANFHHCVIVQLSSECWMLVDPYQHTTGVVDNPNELGYISSHLDKFALAVPGIVFSTRLVDFHAIRSQLVAELKYVISEATNFEPIEQQLIKALEYGSRIFEPGHFSLEIGVPSYQIATMVLNHLAAWDGEFNSLIDPYELATLTGSQLVWHDSIARLDSRSENDDKIVELVRLLQQVPTDLVHTLNATQIAIHTKVRQHA